uniref:Uncharacterized protein n=1 Tax=Timema shepardi TaxID=629360 RepID=A0A7R9ARU2_TIMSH|nr:unnamed protein product [Timema shepardi]
MEFDLTKLGVAASQLCRVCGRLSQRLTSIFGKKGTAMELAYKIHTHLPILVTKDDLMPLSLCEPCIHKLDLCHDLVNTCLDGDTKIRQILGLPIEREDFLQEEELITIKEEDSSETQPNEELDPKDIKFEVQNQDTLSERLISECDVRSEDCEILNWQEVDQLNPDNAGLAAQPESKINVGAKKLQSNIKLNSSLKKMIKNKPCKLVVIKTKSKEPLSNKEIINVLRTKGEKHKLFVPGKKYSTNILKSFNETSGEQSSELQESEVFMESLETDVTLTDEQEIHSDLEVSSEQMPVTLKKLDEPFSETSVEQLPTTEVHDGCTWENMIASSRKKSITYFCFYCEETMIGTETLLSHHSLNHPDKVFICTKCSPPLVFYESKHLFDKHMLHHSQDWKDNTDITSPFYEPALNEVDSVITLPLTGSADNMIQVEAFDNEEDCSFIIESALLEPEVDINYDKPRVDIADSIIQVNRQFQKKREDDLSLSYDITLNGKDNQEENTSSKQHTLSVVSVKKKRKPRSKYGPYCRYCDLMFDSMEELVMHKSQDSCKTHVCQFCGRQFHTKNKLLEHELLHSKERLFMCEKCGKSFRSSHQLRNHQMIHTSNKKYFCTHCSKSYNTYASYRYHMNTHTNEVYLCDICGKGLKNLGSLRVHSLRHTDPENFKRFACEFCGHKFYSRARMLEHVRCHSKERPFKCPVEGCLKAFQLMWHLKRHALVHSDLRKYTCKVCGSSFKQRKNLNVHVKTHEGNHKYKCSVCQSPFDYLKDLISHRSSHSEEELRANKFKKSQFECPECSRMLSSKVSLQHHMLIHTGEKPFGCNFCNKSFKSKVARDVHLRLHTGEKPYNCSYCEASFTLKSYLVVHERIHTGEAPFKCDKCDKAFRSNVNLHQHSKVHSDNRPYGCAVCSRAFRRREALYTHFRIHTDERPFVCRVCSRGFKQKGDCNKHEKTHYKYSPNVTLSPVFSCPFCKKHFNSPTSVEEHFSTVHGIISSHSEENTMIMVNADDLSNVSEVEIAIDGIPEFIIGN